MFEPDPDPRQDMLAGAFYFLIVLAVIFGLGLFTGKAYSAEPTQTQVEQIYALAYGQVAYQLKLPRLGEFPPPNVRMAKNAWMCEQASQKAPCNVRGLTIGNDIWLDDAADWSDMAMATIIFHEYVHYFQNVAHGTETTVCGALAREVEAYTAQLYVVQKLPTQYEWAERVVKQHLAAYQAAQLRNNCFN